MEEKGLQEIVSRLDAQMPLVRIELSKIHTKADKIDADQRRTMVLFEDTEGKFKLVLDAYVGINQKIEHIEDEIRDIKERAASTETIMKEGFDLLSRKIGQLARPVMG